MIRKPVLKGVLNRVIYGPTSVYISEVTDKIIVCVQNDCSVSYYNRSDGTHRTARGFRSKISTETLSALEDYVKKYGSNNRYKSSYKLAYNSKGELKYPKIHDSWNAVCAMSNSPLQPVDYEKFFSYCDIQVYNLI